MVFVKLDMEREITLEEKIQRAVQNGWISMYESLKLRRASNSEKELGENFEKLLGEKINKG